MMMNKLKRKGIDGDFSDFSLSSPATKIRRLDAELPPIIEEDGFPGAPVIEEPTSPPENGEKAVVLFKPVNTYPLLVPSNISLSVDSDIISGFRKQFLSKTIDTSANECRAVVPWVPSPVPYSAGESVSPAEDQESMEADEMGEASMDIEENCDSSMEQEQACGVAGLSASEGFHQWQQQHCMITQPPHNTFTPVTWFH